MIDDLATAEKLLRLAAKNPNENEAASAAVKAVTMIDRLGLRLVPASGEKKVRCLLCQPARPDQVGICAYCGYAGPGPGHPCTGQPLETLCEAHATWRAPVEARASYAAPHYRPGQSVGPSWAGTLSVPAYQDRLYIDSIMLSGAADRVVLLERENSMLRKQVVSLEEEIGRLRATQTVPTPRKRARTTKRTKKGETRA